MDADDIERWADQQERLPEHLQRWSVFERPQWIWLGRLLMQAGLFRLGQRVCGLRHETDDERAERLQRYWRGHQ